MRVVGALYGLSLSEVEQEYGGMAALGPIEVVATTVMDAAA